MPGFSFQFFILIIFIQNSTEASSGSFWFNASWWKQLCFQTFLSSKKSFWLTASYRSTKDHRFNSCRGLRFFFWPVLGHMLITSFFISSPNLKFTIICLHNILFAVFLPHVHVNTLNYVLIFYPVRRAIIPCESVPVAWGKFFKITRRLLWTLSYMDLFICRVKPGVG